MIADLLAWLQALPQPALVIATGLLVLGETTIGLGFLVPGESGLLVAATTATTPARFVVLWLVVFGCAVVGDSIGYAVGRRYGPRLRETRVVRRHGSAAWDRAAGNLRRHGAWAVLLARFLPVVRTLTPAAAGTSGVPFRRFLPAVVVGAAAWSALHVGLGAALGAAAVQAEKAVSTGGAVVLAVLVTACGAWLVTRQRRRSRNGPGAVTPDSLDEPGAVAAGIGDEPGTGTPGSGDEPVAVRRGIGDEPGAVTPGIRTSARHGGRG